MDGCASEFAFNAFQCFATPWASFPFPRCAAAGAEEVESSSDDEEDENTGIPWMIDGAIAASRRVVVASLC